MQFDAIVLAGGAARRLGGADKPMLDIDGAPMLVHVLDAVATAAVRVVVGPHRAIDRAAIWCQETPPGGGPVAGLAAAVPLTTASTLVVLAADLPRIAPAIDPLLGALKPPADAAMLSTGGRRNHLAAAWRRPALVAALGRFGTPRGVSMRALAARATVAEVADPGWGDDCDTWSDLARHRSRECTMTNQLDAWVDELSTSLGVNPAATDVQLVLDLARDAAHGVARPAAPLTTFLVGLAAGLHGADRAEVTEAAATARRLLATRDQSTSSGSE